MQARGWDDFVEVDANGGFVQSTQQFTINSPANVIASGSSVIETHTGGTAGSYDLLLTGNLASNEQFDLQAVTLEAGVTYTFAERGLADPYMLLYDGDFNYITEDDDGGLGRSSMITFTPTEDGTYYLLASSWYHLDPGAPGFPNADAGDYTIAVWQSDPATDVGDTLDTAGTIGVGTNYGNLDFAGDDDVYAITLTAGQVYTFTYNGGVASEAVDPGESIGVLGLYDSSGADVSDGLWYSSTGETSVTFVAQESGTYYLEALGSDNFFGGTPMVGGYTIDVQAANLADMDPLEAIRWDSADNIDTVDVNGVPTAYVYFGEAGETFGENLPQGTNGWTDAQQAAVMNVLQNEYTPITGINYEVTTDVEQAEFRLLTVPTASYGARFYPQDPAYGTQEGIGTFNLASGGFSYDASLVEGGFSYAVIMHEFGHAHGLAHPHDNGGGSEVMLGVTGAQGSLGVFDLNQGVYTVMSYNDAWQLNPDGPSQLYLDTLDRGWSASLSAFDIAVLQERYGEHAYNTGDNVYELTDIVADASYSTIWDTGGTDAIAYSGDLDARIDLTAATLDYSPTGGGVISFLHNDPEVVATTHPALLLHGGYTIANGVVIENATGGSGDDALLGNSVNNVLTGNAGDDVLIGRGGGDTLNGGIGFDTASYIDSASGVTASLATMTGSGGDAAGDHYIGVEALEGSGYNDTLTGGNHDDTLSGLGGNDRLSGANGTDTLNGGDGDDSLRGGNGDDVLNGGAGSDQLFGENGGDVINGGAGNDQLFGDNGGDVLNGGAGDDMLTGGHGPDLFVFADAGHDTIVDYARGEDIDLSALHVTMDDITISSSGIHVELGANDLDISFNARGFSASDLILDDSSEMSAFNAALAMDASGMHGAHFMF